MPWRVLGHDNIVSSSILKEIHLKPGKLNIVLQVKSMWNVDESSTLLSKAKTLKCHGLTRRLWGFRVEAGTTSSVIQNPRVFPPTKAFFR